MAITGPGPLDSDNAHSEFRRIAFSILRRVNRHIDGPIDPKVESAVLGDLYALLALCKAHPAAGTTMATGQVAEWREKFMAWAEAPPTKIPRKHAAGYKDTAQRIFEELEQHAGIMPRDFWYVKTDDG
jgi:hypothetical protein